jgi:hypothetical protein
MARLTILFVCAFGGLIVAGVAYDSFDPYVVFWSTFLTLGSLSMCAFNYLENGIFWFWGMDYHTRKGKEFKRNFRNKLF